MEVLSRSKPVRCCASTGHCLYVCVLCGLLTPFIPAAVCVSCFEFCFGAHRHMNVGVGGVYICVNGLSPLGTLTVRVYTH